MKTTANTRDDIDRFAALIKGIKVAMLTTITDDGSMRSRPMATQTKDFDRKHLWFFTKRSSPKSQEIASHHEVHLSYASPEDHRYVSVTGIASLVDDEDKKTELWSAVHKAWFPEGLDDPDLALLRVDVRHAEYWEAKGGRMVQLIGALRAAAAAKSAAEAFGEHGAVRFGGATETTP